MVHLEFAPLIEPAPLFASSSNTAVYVWDLKVAYSHAIFVADKHRVVKARFISGRSTRKLSGCQYTIAPNSTVSSCLHWSNFDANVLATCSDEKCIRLFDTRSKAPVQTIVTPRAAHRVRWSSHDSNLMASSHDGNVKIWVRKGLL